MSIWKTDLKPKSTKLNKLMSTIKLFCKCGSSSNLNTVRFKTKPLVPLHLQTSYNHRLIYIHEWFLTETNQYHNTVINTLTDLQWSTSQKKLRHRAWRNASTSSTPVTFILVQLWSDGETKEQQEARSYRAHTLSSVQHAALHISYTSKTTRGTTATSAPKSFVTTWTSRSSQPATDW